jgi:magnesium transporter
MTRALLYDATGKDREIQLKELKLSKLGTNQLLWIDTTWKESEAPKNFPEKIRESLASAGEAGALEILDDHYRFAVSVRGDDKAKLAFVVGNSWLVTLADERPAFFDDFIEADRGETLKGRMTPTAMAASLLLRHVDEYRADVAGIDSAIDKLDETILRSREKRTPLTTLAALRRRVSRLRAILSDQRGVIHGLITPDFLAHVDEGDHPYLIQINRAFERLEDDVVRARETVVGAFELYATRVAQDTNQLVKALTIATVITGIIGAVAGVFGMNFDTPVSHSGLPGFLIVTAGMFAAAIAITGIAFWRRWL